jgi:hypothetical protein
MALTIAKLEALRIRAYREEGYLVLDDDPARGILVPHATWKTIKLMNRFTELVGLAIVEDLEASTEPPSDPPMPKRTVYRCSRCGVTEMSGELPPESSGRLRIYPLPAGWRLVSCPDLDEDDHLHCSVCVEPKRRRAAAKEGG